MGIAFFNALLSYLLVFVITVVGVGLAIFAGITWRKAKNKEEFGSADATGESK